MSESREQQYEQFAQSVVGTVLTRAGIEVEMDVEVPHSTQTIDVVFAPGRRMPTKGNALDEVRAAYARWERDLIDRVYEKTFEEAFEEGRKEGFKEGMASMLLRLLTRRFGEPPDAVTARVTRASVEHVERWLERAVDAATLDDVFAH